MLLSGETIQFLSAICVNFLSCSLGASMGWSNSGMSFLLSQKSDLSTGRLTQHEADVIDSMYSLGGLFGSLSYGFVCDKIGRKMALNTIVVPQVIAYLLIGLSENSMMIAISRFFSGFSGGALYITVPLFVSEIAEVVIRGALGTLFIFMSGTGLLLSYCIGPWMRYNTTVWVLMALPVLYILTTFMLPETPFHLLKKNKLKTAENSMKFYRGVKSLKGNVKVEFEAIRKYVQYTETEAKPKLSDYMRKAALKSILIGIVLVANEQFSGTFVLLFGISRVFQRSGAASPTPEIATIIVGVIQLIGSASANLLIDRWGRKPLLIFGTCSVAVGLCVFGIVSQLMEHVETSTFVKTIPVIALSWVVFVANVGVFPLTFVILSEISPENVKGGIFSLCMSFSWIFSFSVFQMRTHLIEMFGNAGEMYFFAFNSVLAATFIVLFLPETAGKTFEEISSMMNSETFMKF